MSMVCSSQHEDEGEKHQHKALGANRDTFGSKLLKSVV